MTAPATGFMTSRRFWLFAGLGLLVFFYLVKGILLPFVVGLGAAYFLDPAADRLEKWGCSRTSATALITLGFFFLLCSAIAALTPLLYQQFSGLLQELPAYIQVVQQAYLPKIQELLDALGNGQDAQEALSGISGNIAEATSGLISGVVASSSVIVSLASMLLLTPVVTFYLLRDWDQLVARVDDLLPREQAPVIREQVSKIDDTLASFVRGQMNVCAILGAFYAVALSLVGLKFGVLIGMAAGMLVIIPYVGTVVSATLALGVAYMQFPDLADVALVGVVFVFGQMLEGYFLTPKLVGDRVGLHPVWVIFGMLAGAALFGFVGVLLAVPVSAVIGVLVRFAIEQYKQSEAYGAALPETQTALPPAVRGDA